MEVLTPGHLRLAPKQGAQARLLIRNHGIDLLLTQHAPARPVRAAARLPAPQTRVPVQCLCCGLARGGGGGLQLAATAHMCAATQGISDDQGVTRARAHRGSAAASPPVRAAAAP